MKSKEEKDLERQLMDVVCGALEGYLTNDEVKQRLGETAVARDDRRTVRIGIHGKTYVLRLKAPL